LRYRLRMTSEIVRLNPSSRRGVWTLTPRGDSVLVRFDWRVNADRMLLRVFTPVLRPLFRTNHNYAISRAKVALEPFARVRAATSSREPKT
jgi:hypothetical protein